MSLTTARGPLSMTPARTNYRIDGPAHRLFFDAFPRRVRAFVHDVAVLDTRAGMLLYETGLLPQLYVPRADVRMDLLEQTAHVTHCPFKGEASYWSIHVGDRMVENAAWAYPTPIASASWLQDYVAFYWRAIDRWMDEDETVEGHLRDPYHRVDVRRSSRRVEVRVGERVVADSRRAVLLSETGLPNRRYLPLADVHEELLVVSDTHTICPYKGTASYRSLRVADRIIRDAAWYYPDPFDGVQAIRDHLCFLAQGVSTWVDGAQIA
ncbi:MAG TPA: DUF427 domain-containing protein [Nevskiaceae bacterium]